MSKLSVFKAAKRLYFVAAALLLAAAGCGLRDPFFVPVSFIDGVPETGTAGTPLTLTAKVRPGFASNRDIAWLVADAGTTEASISGNVLYTAASGTAVIKAKIANGIAEGKDFTQDFTIVFSGAASVVYTVTFETNGGGAIAPQSVAKGQKAHKPDDPVKSGFDFVNWYDNEGLTDPPYNFDTPVTADITLYGYWIPTGTGISVTGVTLNKTSISLTVGATETLTYDITPDNATNKAVSWSTSNNTVATVSTTGTVTAIAAGTVTITVTTADGGKTATCAVTVSAAFDATFNSIAAFAAWLAAQDPNSADTAYHAKLNIDDLGGYSDIPGSLGYALLFQNPTKYVSIDLSGSTITNIEEWAFDQCETLTGITIPNSVTVIEQGAFRGCASLTSVTIPNSVTSIGSNAFRDCTDLTNVTLPTNASFTSIGSDVFHNCTSLTSVTIPNSVTSIGSAAFWGCTSLASVTIPNSVTSIGNTAFWDCTSLTSITIPNNVTSIGGGTFRGCTSLTSVTIPSSVTSIGALAFYGCTGLTSVRFEGTITSDNFNSSVFGSSGYGYIGDLRDKYLVSGPGTYTRPDTSSATWTKQSGGGGTSVTGVTLAPPALTMTVGETAALTATVAPSNATNKAVTWKSSNSAVATVDTTGVVTAVSAGSATITVTTVDGGFTATCAVTVSAAFDATSTTIAAMKAWLDAQPSNNTTTYRITLNVDDLGGSYSTAGSAGNAFYTNNNKYVSLDLSGSTFTSIGEWAFYGCTGLTSVTIPNSVTSIGQLAFYNCNRLTSITIPNSVTSIGVCAFYYCTNLTGVTIPNSVTSIGSAAFWGCTNLTAINVDAANTAYSSENGILYNKTKTTLITYPAGKVGSTFTIPNSVTSIGEGAFRSCASLTSITIPDSVTSIGANAFSSCASLTSVTIPNSVTSIGSEAFYDCYSLTSVTIPNSVTSIRYGAFNGCTSLASVTIPNSVTSIDAGYNDGAFQGCTSLTSVTIPNSVTSIGEWAFMGCTSLTSVRFERADTTLNGSAFIDSVNSTSLQAAYTSGGIGTYTRPNTSSTTWTKQP